MLLLTRVARRDTSGLQPFANRDRKGVDMPDKTWRERVCPLRDRRGSDWTAAP